MRTELISHINSAKRNCTLCHAYRNLKSTTEQEKITKSSTRKAYNLLNNIFEELKSKDADIKQIENAKKAKSLCLDALDACTNCDKQRPYVKEFFINIK